MTYTVSGANFNKDVAAQGTSITVSYTHLTLPTT